AAPLGSFRLAGTIISEDTGEPIGGSTISFSSSKGSPLAVDFDSGKYVSWPIECGDGLIQLKAEAAGYNAEEKTVARAAKGEKLVVDFKLRPFGKAAVGVLRGVLKSRETGEVIKNAKIWIPRLNKKLKSDKNGKFSITVKAGQYSIKVSHRKYRTQEKLLKLTPGDTIILNLDMVPK
ncbi:carboxypeptidase-like regulatory domain-containing protein, partial [Myxococcota bacterium]|nr:carboxypeptidase-like regulatory domain-containing protein [Myxococcota bacterium]